MGVSLYFDLLTPGKLHSEQQLWTDITDIMGRDFEFDMGFPKKTGEFLVTGSCFAPQGETREASKVWVRIGPVEKELWVFGDRSWKNGYLTKASPFTEMPISWRNAFGGEGYASNPLGKGFLEVADEEGKPYRPASQRGKSRTVDRLAGKQTAPFELRPAESYLAPADENARRIQ